MAEYKNSGLDRKSLAEIKSKRLEEALSAYTPEQTKETVSKLLEAYTDDGKNYFGAGARDTTLYFADDEYIREIEKEKAASAEKAASEDSGEPEKEKNSFVGKLHKLTSFITASDEIRAEEEPAEKSEPEKPLPGIREVPISELGAHAEERPAEKLEPEEKPEPEEKEQEAEAETAEAPKEAETLSSAYDEAAAELEKQTAEALEGLAADNINIPQDETDKQSAEPLKAKKAEAEPKPEEPEEKSEQSASDKPEYEPTIVIKPVKPEDIEKAEKTEEDTEEMRREFFDNEIEVDEVPRRRRKHTEPAPEPEEVKEPEPEYEDEEYADDEYEDDYDDDEYEDDIEEKKGKFGGFFSRKKKDDFYDDDDEYDDEDFDDEYYDDDDEYDEGIFTVGRVINILVIIALICSTAFFAASNYTNSKKLESANTQINELNNGNAAGGADEQINQLKAQIDTLTAENARLKSGGTQTGTTPASGTTPTTPASTTISGTAPADESDSSDSSSSASGSTYTIKAGDTGSKICNAVYGQYTPELWEKILSANNMTTSTVYHPGDVLQIP